MYSKMYFYYNLYRRVIIGRDIKNVYLCVIITFWIPQDMTQKHNLYFYRIIRHTIYETLKNWIFLTFN